MKRKSVRERFEAWHYREVGYAVDCWRARDLNDNMKQLQGYARADIQWLWNCYQAAFAAGRKERK